HFAAPLKLHQYVFGAAAQKLLVQFRDFARDDDVALPSKHFDDVAQRLEDAMWCFVKSCVRGELRIASSAVRRAPAFGGRNPPKRKESVGRPLATSADRNADAPGTGTTRM